MATPIIGKAAEPMIGSGVATATRSRKLSEQVTYGRSGALSKEARPKCLEFTNLLERRSYLLFRWSVTFSVSR